MAQVEAKTPKYQAFLDQYDSLVDAVEPVIGKLARKLRLSEKKFVSESSLKEAENTAKDLDSRVRNLLSHILKKIEEEDSNFDTFVDILKGIQKLKHVAEALTQTRKTAAAVSAGVAIEDQASSNYRETIPVNKQNGSSSSTKFPSKRSPRQSQQAKTKPKGRATAPRRTHSKSYTPQNVSISLSSSRKKDVAGPTLPKDSEAKKRTPKSISSQNAFTQLSLSTSTTKDDMSSMLPMECEAMKTPESIDSQLQSASSSSSGTTKEDVVSQTLPVVSEQTRDSEVRSKTVPLGKESTGKCSEELEMDVDMNGHTFERIHHTEVVQSKTALLAKENKGKSSEELETFKSDVDMNGLTFERTNVVSNHSSGVEHSLTNGVTAYSSSTCSQPVTHTGMAQTETETGLNTTIRIGASEGITVHVTRLRSDTHYHDIYFFLKNYANHWRDIGLALGFLPNELDVIQSNPFLLTQGPPSSYLGEMLTKWLQWAPAVGRGNRNFATFEDLRAALLRVLGSVAYDLGPPISIGGNVPGPPHPEQPSKEIVTQLSTSLGAGVGLPQNSHSFPTTSLTTGGSMPSCPGDTVLNTKDHLNITQSIKEMGNADLIALGQALGLFRHKLQRMNDMPGDMVAAWLRQEDHVISETEDPTWRVLADACDKVDQGGFAKKIRNKHNIPHPVTEGGSPNKPAPALEHTTEPLSSSGTEDPGYEVLKRRERKPTIYFNCTCNCNSRGRCTFQDFIVGKCNGSLKNQFPYLDVDGLSLKEEKRLLTKLFEDTESIKNSFSSLVDSIADWLTDHLGVEVSFGKLIMISARNVSNKVQVDELRSAKDVYDLFLLLEHYKLFSFFNYKKLFEIVETFGTRDDKDIMTHSEERTRDDKDKFFKNLMQTYLTEFTTFCKRSVFEVPAAIFGDNSPETETTFVLKVSEDYFSTHSEERKTKAFTMQDLRNVQREIMKRLELKDDLSFMFPLHVAKGCVEITFGVISTVPILPFTQKQVECLLDIHIKVVAQCPGSPSKVFRDQSIQRPLLQQGEREMSQGFEKELNILLHSNTTPHDVVLLANKGNTFIGVIPSSSKAVKTNTIVTISCLTANFYTTTITPESDYESSSVPCTSNVGFHHSLATFGSSFQYNASHHTPAVDQCETAPVVLSSTISTTITDETTKCSMKSVTAVLLSKGSSNIVVVANNSNSSTTKTSDATASKPTISSTTETSFPTASLKPTISSSSLESALQTKSCFSRAPKLTGASKTCSATLESSRTLPNFSASAVHASASGSALHNIRVRLHNDMSAVVGTNSFEQIDGTLINGLDTVTAVSPQQMVGLSCSGETMTPQCHIATTAQTIINFHPDCVWIPKDCSPKTLRSSCTPASLGSQFHVVIDLSEVQCSLNVIISQLLSLAIVYSDCRLANLVMSKLMCIPQQRFLSPPPLSCDPSLGSQCYTELKQGQADVILHSTRQPLQPAARCDPPRQLLKLNDNCINSVPGRVQPREDKHPVRFTTHVMHKEAAVIQSPILDENNNIILVPEVQNESESLKEAEQLVETDKESVNNEDLEINLSTLSRVDLESLRDDDVDSVYSYTKWTSHTGSCVLDPATETSVAISRKFTLLALQGTFAQKGDRESIDNTPNMSSASSPLSTHSSQEPIIEQVKTLISGSAPLQQNTITDPDVSPNLHTQRDNGLLPSSDTSTNPPLPVQPFSQPVKHVLRETRDQPSDTYTPDKHKRDIRKSKSNFKTKYDEQIFLTTENEGTVQQNMKVDYTNNIQQFMYHTPKNIMIQFRSINGPTSTQHKVNEGFWILFLVLDSKSGLMKYNQSTKQIQVLEDSSQYNNDLHIPLSHQAQLTMFEFKQYGVVEYLLRLGPEFEDNFKPISPQNITKTIAINLFLKGLGLSEFFSADLELDSHLSDEYKYKTDEPWCQKKGMLHCKELHAPIQRLDQEFLMPELVQHSSYTYKVM